MSLPDAVLRSVQSGWGPVPRPALRPSSSEAKSPGTRSPGQRPTHSTESLRLGRRPRYIYARGSEHGAQTGPPPRKPLEGHGGTLHSGPPRSLLRSVSLATAQGSGTGDNGAAHAPTLP